MPKHSNLLYRCESTIFRGFSHLSNDDTTGNGNRYFAIVYAHYLSLCFSLACSPNMFSFEHSINNGTVQIELLCVGGNPEEDAFPLRNLQPMNVLIIHLAHCLCHVTDYFRIGWGISLLAVCSKTTITVHENMYNRKCSVSINMCTTCTRMQTLGEK